MTGVVTTGSKAASPAVTGNVVVTNPDTQSATLTNGFTYAVRGDANNNGVAKVAAIYAELHKLPLNSSPTRIHNRCLVTGRPKGYIRRFGLSRITMREYAHLGLLPGVTKSSW